MGIPKFLDGNADEDENKRDGDHPDDDEGADDIRPSLEIGHPEDAVVHQQEAELRPDQVENVEDLSDDEELCDHDDVFYWYRICMQAHAFAHHCKDERDDEKVPALFLQDSR